MKANQQKIKSVEAFDLTHEVYFQTVNQAPVAICITDPEALILYTNTAFSEATGYSFDEIKGQHSRVLSAGKTPTSIYTELWNTILKQQIWTGRLVNQRKDNSNYLAELTITPVIDPEGKTSHYLGMHRDITRLQQLDLELNNQRTLTETVIRHSPIATLLLDNKHNILFENPALGQLCLSLGCNVEQLLDTLANSLGLPIVSNNHFTGLELRYDIQGIATPRWLVCSGVTLQLWGNNDSFTEKQAKDCLLVTINDITELKIQQREARLNALMARLAEDELTYSMRETLNGAIYQLQRPLNITGAATAIQKKRHRHDDPLLHALGDISNLCQRAIDTLTQALPAPTVRHKMPLNINELLREVLSLYAGRLLSDGVIIDWRPCNTPPNILGDDVALCNLFKQLFDNALDAMGEARTTERNLQISTELRTDSISVVLADNGPGIADNIRNKIFEPFFSVHKKIGNRGGMGLVLVQDIANDHGAIIEMKNNKNSGCCFTLTFPLLSADEGLIS